VHTSRIVIANEYTSEAGEIAYASEQTSGANHGYCEEKVFVCVNATFVAFSIIFDGTAESEKTWNREDISHLGETEVG
jgi:hypothetical protein